MEKEVSLSLFMSTPNISIDKREKAENGISLCKEKRD